MVDTFPQELPYSAIIKNKIQAVKRIPASSSLMTDPKYTVQNSDGLNKISRSYSIDNKTYP